MKDKFEVFFMVAIVSLVIARGLLVLYWYFLDREERKRNNDRRQKTVY